MVIENQIQKKITASILIILFLGMTSFLDAQEETQLFNRRIVWRGGEYAFRYAVEIQKLENENYRSFLREYTTSLFLEVSLSAGAYRFRIIPYDILDRPSDGTQWFNFNVHVGVTETIDINDYNLDNRENTEGSGTSRIETTTVITRNENVLRFNTLGVSLGTSFVDPIFIATAHGSFAPIRYLFIEFGCDFGFISSYEEVEGFYLLYPFAHLGVFIPFTDREGFFIGAGGGYMIGNYAFVHGTADIFLWGVNFITGFNLFNGVNLSYTFTTNFSEVKHKLSAGYVFRF
jgi:hypothetical protein